MLGQPVCFRVSDACFFFNRGFLTEVIFHEASGAVLGSNRSAWQRLQSRPAVWTWLDHWIMQTYRYRHYRQTAFFKQQKLEELWMVRSRVAKLGVSKPASYLLDSQSSHILGMYHGGVSTSELLNFNSTIIGTIPPIFRSSQNHGSASTAKNQVSAHVR